MAEKSIILAVDSNRHNLELLIQYLGQEGYETRSASSLAELNQAIKENKMSLVLIDLSGFDQRIWERCEQLRKARIPFIIISTRRSLIVQQESMKHGARGVLVKPLGVKELVGYIHALLVE